MGLVWRLLKGEPIYDGYLSRREIDDRVESCWRPYHMAVSRAISMADERHGTCVHLNCHSMPARAHVYPAELDHTMPFDFLVGDRDGTTADPDLTEWIANQLRAEGYSVGVNQIFKGVELVQRHGDPARGRHSVQIEVNKRLYMDEERLALHEGYGRVQASLKRLVKALVERHGT